MKIPFRIRRTWAFRPTRALLIPGRDSAALLRLCARLGLDAPRIFVVADGFLLRVTASIDRPVAGAIRLGELASNLLLPIDAELAPTLLADEACALGRERGFIFLPGNRILEFDPAEPINLADLITIGGLRRGAWRSLPAPLTMASRISEIVCHRQGDLPDAIIEQGGAGIAEVEPQPDDASLPSKLLGNSVMRLGQTLGWLGGRLGIKALASLGGALMAGGLGLVPRLSEKVMGKQEAGLRELLEEFRKGNVESALRRALPLDGIGRRGAVLHQGTQLPTRDLGYSLGNILGRWGPASLWYSPDELLRELQREYRKQAEAATQRGDYRRAAFIYGKLLGDYPLAAAVLAQGGLHHDAAIICLKRLQNFPAAAREFEAAGEIDEALRLYRHARQHVQAGDLLRRLGDDQLAVAEYIQAADLLVEKGHGHCQAGELMLAKADRPDLAARYFTAGWQSRPNGSAVACARCLAQLYAQNADNVSLLRLTEEAQDFFGSPGNEALAAEFCNEVARLAERSALAPIRETLRDRCLMTLAHKLRQGWENMGHLASQLFGPDTVWNTPLVNDAHFAARIARQRGAPWITNADVNTVVIQGRIPIVRAVGHARESGEIFLGFESGEIACLHPRRGDTDFVTPQLGAVYGLAVDAAATSLVALSAGKDAGSYQLSCYTRLGQWRMVETRVLESADGCWLCPMLARTRDLMASLFDPGSRQLRFIRLPRLLPEGSMALEDCFPLTGIPMMLRESHARAVLDPIDTESIRSAAYLLFDGREMWHVSYPHGQDQTTQRVLCGIQARLASSSLDVTPLSWLSTGPGRLEVAGIGAEGSLSWLDIEFRPGQLLETKTKSAPGPFRAAALVRPGVIAAVADDGIVWLRAGAGAIKEQLRQRVSLSDVVACFPNNDMMELIILSGNGTVARVRHAV